MAAMVITIPDPKGQIARLLDAAVAVQQLDPPCALVGGMGVICRLPTAHRPTLDADTVVERTDTDVVGILRSRTDAGPASDDATVVIGGAKVEIIEIEPIAGPRSWLRGSTMIAIGCSSPPTAGRSTPRPRWRWTPTRPLESSAGCWPTHSAGPERSGSLVRRSVLP